jgi:MoaA/NifB/PqqE/SkfB family radical SAM enzyme
MKGPEGLWADACRPRLLDPNWLSFSGLKVVVSGRDMMNEALELLRKGRTQEGTRRLREAVEVQPDLIEAWGHLSGVMAYTGRHEDAIQCLEHVLRFSAQNIEARWRMADRLIRLNRFEEAETLYQSVLESEPGCEEASYGLKYLGWLRRHKQDASNIGEPSGNELPGSRDDPRLDCPGIEQRKFENEQRAAKHFEYGDLSLTSLPIHLNVETTTRCNAACISCAKGHGAVEAEDLQPEVFEKIERQLLPLARTINLAGLGEPLLAARFDEFYARATRNNAFVHFVTNGTALTIERLDRFARRKSFLAVSIDGATRETFESIRHHVRFDRVMESLRLYKKIRAIYPEVGATLAFNFVAMRRNIAELPAVVDLASEVAADSIVVIDLATPHLPPEIAAEHLSHCPDLANRLFDEASERARERGIGLYLPPKYPSQIAPSHGLPVSRLRGRWRLCPERNRFPHRCADPWVRTYISAEGFVRPCCVSGRVMGNLAQQDFDEIWNGHRYRWFRRRVKSCLPPVECLNCSIPWGMNAGNPSVVRAREGILIKSFYRIEGLTRRCVRTIRKLLS